MTYMCEECEQVESMAQEEADQGCKDCGGMMTAISEV